MRTNKPAGRGGRAYTDDERKFISDNWLIMSDAEMGAMIERTEHGVQQLRWNLGLKRPRNNSGVPKGTLLAACPLPPRPRGITAAQRLYARAYPDCREAQAIRGMLMEEDQRR